MRFKVTLSMTVTLISAGIIGAVALSHEEIADCAAMVGRRAGETTACVLALLAESVTAVMREVIPHAEDPAWAAEEAECAVEVACGVAEAGCGAVAADGAN